MSAPAPFMWRVLSQPHEMACDACKVYVASYRIHLSDAEPLNFLDLCVTCATRLRLVTKEIQRHIQGAAPKKVRP